MLDITGQRYSHGLKRTLTIQSLIEQVSRGAKTSNQFLKSALEYSALGWAVFPVHTIEENGVCSCGQQDCSSPGKHPRTKNGCNDATTDKAIIQAWADKWPNSNIAIATGVKSGLVVLDVDNKDGSEGDDSLTELEEHYGALPLTAVVITGGNGRHYYFKHPGGIVKNKAGLRPSLDIRADGGYVVAPYSKHVSRQIYEWEQGAFPDDVPLALLPIWLLEIEKKQLSSEPGPERLIREGERNNTLIRMAGAMRRQGMNFESILSGLLQQNEEFISPLNDSEVERIAQSVLQYSPVQEPQHCTPLGNMYRFIDHFLDEIFYNLDDLHWYVWDGQRFQRDAKNPTLVLEKAKRIPALILAEAAVVQDSGERKKLTNWSIRTETEQQLKQIISLAASDPRISIRSDQIDADPWLLNVSNGTIDLHTGKLFPHNRKNRITKIVPVPYDPSAICQKWEDALRFWMGGKQHMVDYLQRAVARQTFPDKIAC